MADSIPTPARALPTSSALKDFLAGAVGGASQVLVGQPLVSREAEGRTWKYTSILTAILYPPHSAHCFQDTIKTRAQVAPHGMFKGPMDVAVQTIKNEGFMALYKGMLSPLIGIAGVNSLLFAAYSYGKKIISPYPELTLAQTAGAGAFAGAANAILASPVEMFKVGNTIHSRRDQFYSRSRIAPDSDARAVYKEWGKKS